ncbi:MAG: DNA translocase FtsK 4TM domain-containing protein [Chloroflexota bacterium]|nr:DNA translocase FtsK 4TM domain-containing protein [Chloroflexota bacterium]
MAARRSTTQQKSSSRQSGLPLPFFRLPSPLRREVFGVLSIVIGLLSGIALLSPSGTVSGLWHELLVVLFGWMAPLPALASVVLGIQLIRDGITQERYVRWETLTALTVLVLAATAFGQAIAGPPEMALAYPVGGAIGLQILAPLTTALGFAGAVIVLFALLLITTIITFSISLGRIRSALGGIWFLVRLIGKGIGVLFRAAGGAYRRMGDRTREPEQTEPPQPRALNVRVASNVNASNGSAAPALPAMEVVAPNPVAADDPTESQDAAADPDSETAMETEADEPNAPPRWQLPPPDLLTPAAQTEDAAEATEEIEQRALIIEEALRSFKVVAEVAEAIRGPAVTQYRLTLGQGIKVSRVINLANDLALALAATSVRIEAPVPGFPFVGIEIPNQSTTIVTMREFMNDPAFAEHAGMLPLALGRDVANDARVTDLATMPHLLIAGATGSGKSACVNAIICSLLMQHTPETLRFLVVDPKMVEMIGYSDIPHLLRPVITDLDEVVPTLMWAADEMTRRYKVLAQEGFRNIQTYNTAKREAGEEPMHYLVILIDELADLMMTAAGDVEKYLCRLAQMARAVGIHLVVSTQRPSVDVLTGLIKANFPCRIAFAVSSQADSRTILDGAGAEKLIGQGDMLFAPKEATRLTRIQGTYLADDDISRIVQFWREQGAPEYIPEKSFEEAAANHQENKDDDLVRQAIRLVSQYENASASFLQRQLGIGATKANRILDALEERGIVTPPEGLGRVRHVLVTAGDLLDDDDEDPPFDLDDKETADEKDEEFSRFPV